MALSKKDLIPIIVIPIAISSAFLMLEQFWDISRQEPTSYEIENRLKEGQISEFNELRKTWPAIL